MGRIQQLPEELRDEINRLLRQGISQVEILDRLKNPLQEAGQAPISRSSLNRYATRMEQTGRRIREAREIAGVWTQKFGEAPTGDLSSHIIEMLRTLTFEITLKAGDDGAEDAMDVEDVNKLALAVQRLETAAAQSHRREREIREEVAAQAEKEMKRAGISGPVASAVRAALGGDS